MKSNSLVEIGQREKLLVPQHCDEPPFCQKHSRFDFRFVSRLVGTCWHDGHVIMLRQFEIGAIQIGVVAAGTSDAGAGVVGYYQLGRTLKKFKGSDVTFDPVGQVLAQSSPRKSIGTGPEGGDKQ